MKIAIIGQGYVGRSIAEASVGAGHSVKGFDTNSEVISSLKIRGDFKGTTDASLISDAEVIVIAGQHLWIAHESLIYRRFMQRAKQLLNKLKVQY